MNIYDEIAKGRANQAGQIFNALPLDLDSISKAIKADLLKSGAGLPIGTLHTWGGVKMRKDQAGWVPVKEGRDNKMQSEAEVKEGADKTPIDLAEHAKGASQAALQNAVKSSNDSEVRAAASKELKRRGTEESGEENFNRPEPDPEPKPESEGEKPDLDKEFQADMKSISEKYEGKNNKDRWQEESEAWYKRALALDKEDAGKRTPKEPESGKAKTSPVKNKPDTRQNPEGNKSRAIPQEYEKRENFGKLSPEDATEEVVALFEDEETMKEYGYYDPFEVTQFYGRFDNVMEKFGLDAFDTYQSTGGGGSWTENVKKELGGEYPNFCKKIAAAFENVLGA